ncbi:MAG: WbqC family protein [Bacteroidales bacterium]|jgi:hypothetical protein|nr:WbqC family protein [Bacteroidales bacterium]
MKLAIMQPYIFPYLGYFQLINAADKFVILDDVNFIMRGWINRNRILVNGKEHLFSVPVAKATQNRIISECEIADDKWGLKFLKTLELSYKRAPNFITSFEVINSILAQSETNLSKWLTFQLKAICKYLDIKTEIVETSRINNNRRLKAQDKIIDICKQEGADLYINAIGGKELYDDNVFRSNNIKLKFIKTIPEKYKQFNSDFVPFLSIIDVMMFNNKNDIRNLLNKYELI